MQKISLCLWFDDQAEEAAKFYTSIFKNSKIGNILRYSVDTPSNKPVGSVLTVEFELDGQKFMGLNGGPMFKFNEAVSLVVGCEDQAEIDYFWERLSAVPESEQCGWCKDKFGVSWQIVPRDMDNLINSPKAMAAMMQMKKIDIAALQAAGQEK